MYQTNDGNDRKSCAVFVRVRASVDDADTRNGRAGGGLRNEKQERTGEGPTFERVCVRRFPKLKHRKQISTRGQSRGRKTVLHHVISIHRHPDTHVDMERSLQGQICRRM